MEYPLHFIPSKKYPLFRGAKHLVISFIDY